MERTSKRSRWLSTTTAVYIYAFLSGIPFGAIGPATIQAIEHLVLHDLGFEGKNTTSTGPCSEQGNNTAGNDEDNAAIQAHTSSVVFIGGTASSLPSLLFVIFLSSWSDGSRSYNQLRFVAVLPCVGITLHMAGYILILSLNLSPWWTLIPSVVLALGGGFYLQIATMLSYLMSSCGDTDRSVFVMYLQMMSFSAQGAAQLGTGYIIEGAGFITSFVVLFFICLGTTIFVAIFPPIKKEKFADDTDNAPNGEEARDRGVLSAFKAILALFRNPDTGGYNVILALYTVSLLMYVMLTVYFMILIQIFVLGAPFCWSPTLVGYFGIAKLVSCATGLLIVAQVMKRYFNDGVLVQIGLLSMLVSTVIPIYARTDTGIFMIAAFGCFRIVPGAVITASVSNHAAQQNFGSLFGVTSAIEGLASFLAPLIFGSIYTATVADDSRFVFKLMAGLSVIPSTLIMCIQCWNMTLGTANHKEYQAGALLASKEAPRAPVQRSKTLTTLQE